MQYLFYFGDRTISRSIEMLQPAGNGDSMHGSTYGVGCVSHTGYLAHGNSEGEARGRGRQKRNSNKVVRYLEEWNVGTKDLTIEFPEGCESPCHRLD